MSKHDRDRAIEIALEKAPAHRRAFLRRLLGASAAAAASSEADADGYVFINGRRVRAISTKGTGIKKKRATKKKKVAKKKVAKKKKKTASKKKTSSRKKA